MQIFDVKKSLYQIQNNNDPYDVCAERITKIISKAI
jgi:hypothetical protein